jgi:mannan endo-1,4-beta-mannosidase
MLNIANEAGSETVGQTEYREKYKTAVNQIRNAEIHVPLVIEADRWGRNGDALLDNGPYLVDADPDHNLILIWRKPLLMKFSRHQWFE